MSTETHTHLHAVDAGLPATVVKVMAPAAPGEPEALHPVAVGVAAAPPNGWKQEDLADEDDGGHRWRLVGAFAVLAVITTADLVLIKGTFNRVLREAEALSWTLGAALTLAAVAASYSAGVLTRKVVAAPRTSRAQTLLAVALVGGWAALGAGMFILRWRAAEFAPQQIVFEGASASVAAGLEDVKEKVLAIVLASVYLATGILAFVDGYKLTNPAAKAMRAARRAIRSLRPRLVAQEGLVARLVENLAIHRHDLTTIDTARDTALASRTALAAELKQHARVQIALHLGNPAATGLVRPNEADPTSDPDQEAQP